VAATSVAVITLVNYGLREIVPAVLVGVYLLAVLLVSSYWGLGLFTRAAGRRRVQLPSSAHGDIHAGEWAELGRACGVLCRGGGYEHAGGACACAAAEAGRRRRDADLSAEMAWLLLAARTLRTRRR
jgi:hypothetical protein